MIEAKLRESDKIAYAIKLQDGVRARIKRWNGSKEIIKWRRKR